MARAKAKPVKIIVDVHERQSGIAETLAELGAEIETAPLPAGYYAVGASAATTQPSAASSPEKSALSQCKT